MVLDNIILCYVICYSISWYCTTSYHMVLYHHIVLYRTLVYQAISFVWIWFDDSDSMWFWFDVMCFELIWPFWVALIHLFWVNCHVIWSEQKEDSKLSLDWKFDMELEIGHCIRFRSIVWAVASLRSRPLPSISTVWRCVVLRRHPAAHLLSQLDGHAELCDP